MALTEKELALRLKKLSDRYEIDEANFYEIIEHFDQAEGSIEDKLIKSFEALLKQTSLEMDTIDNALDMKPTCFKGCAFCCYFPIIVTKIEAKLMRYAMEQFEPKRKENILKHLANYKEQHAATLSEARKIDFKEDPDFKRTYRNLDLPCPLLDPTTNACLAYEVRPTPCRTYVNYLDPTICKVNKMPKETVSFDFLYGPYFEALNTFINWLYEDGNTAFIDYPNDLYEEDYLINWLT